MVEDSVTTLVCIPKRSRRADLPRSDAGDRCARWPGGSCIHRFDRALRRANLSSGGAAWHRLLAPVVGSLTMGYLLFKYFPNARGSGVPQTKAALYARGGRNSLGTVFGKFFCTSVTLASGIPLGREGPSVQVGAGLSSVLGRALRLSRRKSKHSYPLAQPQRWPQRSTRRSQQYYCA